MHLFIFLTVLIVIAAVLLTLLVLVQNSKGGGLASGFASGNQIMGAPKTADFLEKATWWLVGIIVALSICAVWARNSELKNAKKGSEVTEKAAEAASEIQQNTATPDFGEDAE